MGFRGRRGGSPGAALHEQTVVFAFPHVITLSFWNFGEGGSLDSFQRFMLLPDLVTNCEIKISVYDGCVPH